MLSRISGSLPNCLFLYLMGHSVLIDPRIPFDGILVLSIAASAAFPRFLRFFIVQIFLLSVKQRSPLCGPQQRRVHMHKTRRGRTGHHAPQFVQVILPIVSAAP